MVAFHQSINSIHKNYNSHFYNLQEFGLHFHKNIEVIYVVNGKVECKINDKDYVLTENEYGLCLPYEVHSYKPQKDTNYWVCVFSNDYVREFSKYINGKSSEGFNFRLKKNVNDFIKNEFIYANTPSIYIIKSCLYAICDGYTSAVKLSDKNENKFYIVSCITDYIEKNYMKNISLSDIALLLGYDYHYVSRLFNAVFRMSFKDYLNIYRLDAALAMLDETSKKILDIAYESGFQSVRNFNDCFKKHFKITPVEFRSNNTNNRKL